VKYYLPRPLVRSRDTFEMLLTSFYSLFQNNLPMPDLLAARSVFTFVSSYNSRNLLYIIGAIYRVFSPRFSPTFSFFANQLRFIGLCGKLSDLSTFAFQMVRLTLPPILMKNLVKGDKLTLFLETKCREKVNLSTKLGFVTATDIYTL